MHIDEFRRVLHSSKTVLVKIKLEPGTKHHYAKVDPVSLSYQTLTKEEVYARTNEHGDLFVGQADVEDRRVVQMANQYAELISNLAFQFSNGIITRRDFTSKTNKLKCQLADLVLKESNYIASPTRKIPTRKVALA